MRTAALRKPAFEPLYVSRERILLIHGTHYNLNLRDLYVSIYGEPRGDEDVLFVAAPGARIRSHRAHLPACCSGVWSVSCL